MSEGLKSEQSEADSISVITIMTVGQKVAIHHAGVGAAQEMGAQLVNIAVAAFRVAEQTAVPESERCGEKSEPASAPIG